MDFWRITVGRRDESSLGSKALIQSNGISFGVDKVFQNNNIWFFWKDCIR